MPLFVKTLSCIVCFLVLIQCAPSSQSTSGIVLRTASSGTYYPTRTSPAAVSKRDTPDQPQNVTKLTWNMSFVSTIVTARSNATTTNSAIPEPADCGEYGRFTLNWDDEPMFNPTDYDNGFVFPPVFNPYHQLFFSNGYAYAPPPDSPFKPISPPHLAIFLPNSTTKDIVSPSAAGARPGELGSGPHASINAFWFDAYGAYMGCDNGGPTNCLMTVRGFVWSESQGVEVLSTWQTFTVPPCTGFVKCQMRYYNFGEQNQGLSGLQISASVEHQPRIFFMDNLKMGWSNDSCAAGLLRMTSRK